MSKTNCLHCDKEFNSKGLFTHMLSETKQIEYYKFPNICKCGKIKNYPQRKTYEQSCTKFYFKHCRNHKCKGNN